MSLPQLPIAILVLLGGLAAASLIVPALSLAAARRRAAPLCHGILLCAVGVLALLPAAPFAARYVDIDWLPRVRLFDLAAGRPASALAGVAADESPEFQTLSAEEIPAGAVLPAAGSRAKVSASLVNDTAAGQSFRSNTIRRWAWLNRGMIGNSLVGLWLLGTLVALTRMLRAATSVTRLVRRSTPVVDPSARALFFDLADELRLRRPPAFRASAHLRVPFAWGFLRSVVVVPERLIEPCDAARLRPILLHELAHVRRHDVWIGLLQRTVGAAYWWNPLVHRLNARLADAREDICDAYVLAGGCPPREYAEILVELAAQISLAPPAAALGLVTRSQPQLTRRVERLLEDQPMSTCLRKLARLSLLGAFALLSTIALLMAYVLVDDEYFRRPSSAESSGVAQTWNPQPVIVNSVQPAAQQFEPPTVAMPTPIEPGAGGAMMMAQNDPFARPGSDFTAGGAAPVYGTAGSGDEAFPSAFDAAGDAAAMGMAPAPATGMGHYMTGNSVRGLAAIELVGNDDGSLKELRWFTESLGIGNEAFSKLTERLTEFAKPRVGTVYKLESRMTDGRSVMAITPYQVAVPFDGFRNRSATFGVGAEAGLVTTTLAHDEGGFPIETGVADIRTDLTAQITASPQLRYEHVARVVELCESHVQQVVVTQANLTPQVTLTLGFVRDGSGKQISSSPVLIWNDAVVPEPLASSFNGLAAAMGGNQMPPQVSPPHDEIVTVDSLAPQLVTWRQTLTPESTPKNLTVLVRADAGVDPKLVERVVQVTLPAGFERVILHPLETLRHSTTESPAATPEPAPDATLPNSNDRASIRIPAMGPAPIAIDFGWPLSDAQSDDNRVFAFYIGFTR